MSNMGEMCAKFQSYRVEFQMQGAGHIHGVFWLDLDEFEKKHFDNDQKSPHIY